MKLTIHFKGQIYVVPCGSGDKSIQWLKEETVRRSEKLNGVASELSANLLEARLKQTHGLLMEDDCISDVLDDNDLVYISSISI